MPARLADRLQAARRRRFVGRDGEREIFQSALSSAEAPFQVLFIFGPGGIGKTALLGEFTSSAERAGLSAPSLDGHNLEATPESFLNGLRRSLDLAEGSDPIQALSRDTRRQILLVDTYEMLSPLDLWLREVFLPQLPDNVLVVLAGREPPPSAWTADPGWQSLVRTISLRNLEPEESREYLSGRNIPADQHRAVLDFTHGHPLALSLVADVFDQRPVIRFQPEAAPDIIKVLLEKFVEKVPGPAHRAALEACALVRLTTEALLSAILLNPEVHDLFEWLRGLSFIEARQGGLAPHDLAREALIADVRWRNPDWYRTLHKRARDYYAGMIQSVPPLEQHRVLFDYVFLHRDNPVVRSMLDWQTSGGVVPDAMRETDRSALVEMVSSNEGADSARLAEKWLTRQPDGVTVYRDEKGTPLGFIAIVGLQQASPADLAADPAAGKAWHYLQKHAPLRAGEVAGHYRFWMARDTYQSVSPVQTAIFLTTVRYQLTTPGLAYHFLPCSEPDFWAGAFGYANLQRLPDLDYQVGDKKHGVYGHDWRVQPPLAWLSMLAEREVGGAAAAGAIAPARPAPLIVLSESEFAQAVEKALRGYARAGGLHGNPLLHSRLVSDRVTPNAEEGERESGLRMLLKEAGESLEANPRDAKLYRSLYHTYFKPQATQERAAELMDVPFSTYRRHLKAGVARVIGQLWEQEIGLQK